MQRSTGRDHGDHLRGFSARIAVRAALPYLVLGLLGVIAVIVLGRELDHHLAAVEDWIADLGPWGPLAFVVLFVVMTSLLVPDTVPCVAAGALFGMAWGVAAVAVGGLVASATQFALARRLLRARVQRSVARRPTLAGIQRAVVRDEFRLQLLVRLTPLNPATISYLLGAAGVHFGGFMMACLAMLPGLVIEVYFGHAGKHIARMATGATTSRVHDLAIIGGVVVCVAVMVVLSKRVLKAVRKAASEESGDATSGS